MMRKQQSQDNSLREQDEHNQPTEPMPLIVPPSSSPTASPTDAIDIPVPQPYERPFPNALPGSANRPPETFAYPYLPPAPGFGKQDRPPGGAIPTSPGNTFRSHPRRSPLPILVGIFFIAVQLLLLVRLVLKIIGKPDNVAWVDIIYNTSNAFILPFRLLAQNIALPRIITSTEEVYTLLAILAYWLLSRILVRLLKALLYSR
jgi:hypothetical protein